MSPQMIAIFCVARMADRDFVTREEFDAVRAMAQKAREENEALKARLDALEGKS